VNISTIFIQLGIALGLGLLVGLQRESVASRLAGVRTFPLITIFGSVCALLANSFGGWTVAAGLIALAALTFAGRSAELKDHEAGPGLTTEIAMLLMFGVGAYLVMGERVIAIAVGAGVAALLQFKPELHGIAARLGAADLKAIMQFALISLVILPVLPDRAYDPYAVLNPREIWLMVVLIVGISLSGYILYKFFSERAGLILGGILGGLISSTATTVSYAKRTVTAPDSSRLAGVVIMIASTIVFARLLLEIGLVAPGFLPFAAPPLLVILTLFALLAGALWWRVKGEQTSMPAQANPTELKAALLFGALYAVVRFAVAAAKGRFGDSGLYTVAALSGLTDVDAITLSTAQLVGGQSLSAQEGWRVILIASMSNLLFKGAMVATLGARSLLLTIAPLYALVLLTGVLLLIFW
jgi:uncharacterized membrane protein (DUF4010 family)